MKTKNGLPFEIRKKGTSNEEIASQLAQNMTVVKDVKKNFLKPKYVEFFGSFNRFGLGTPSGIANYTGGNYVLTVSGNQGDSFVTVQSGNIADAGTSTKWACVIENSDGLFDVNQVIGTDGVSKINLVAPLKAGITSKRLGNLHDTPLGQHYSELGYFAFAQHIYLANPRYAERDLCIAQMKQDATSGKWVSNAYNVYNQTSNMNDGDLTYSKIGSKYYMLSAANNTSYTEWEQKLDGEKGYLEIYVGVNKGTAKVEFFKDGVLSETVSISKPAHRLIFDYEGVQTGKIRLTTQGPFDTGNQAIYIGLTTWWKNEKFQEGSLIKADNKVVYIGDSWGEYHNKATTRELFRLMQSYGGNPTVLDYSKSGHSSTYARAWFDDYVIANNPDVVIIEYFTNDFNSILNGTNLGAFLNPEGQQQTMSISTLEEYVDNIKYMVNKAIENGIQPIVVMPAGTNSETQSQNFANFSTQLWLGKTLIVENPTFNEATIAKTLTSMIESVGTTAVGSNLIKLISKETNSSARKGILSDTSGAITNGDIHGFYNNNVRKAGVRHNGTMEVNATKLTPQSSLFSNVVGDRGTIYLLNSVGTGNIDELRVVIQLADGTFTQKKIQLID